MASTDYSNNKLLCVQETTLVPSKQDIVKIMKDLLVCEDRNLIRSFVQSCVFKYDYLTFPTYAKNEACDTLKQTMCDILNKNLSYYKE